MKTNLVLFIFVIVGIISCKKEEGSVTFIFPETVGTKWIYTDLLNRDTMTWETIKIESINSINCFVIRTRSINSSQFVDSYYYNNKEGMCLLAKTTCGGCYKDSLYVFKEINYFLKYPPTIGSSWTFKLLNDSMGNLYETPLIMTYLKKERVNLSFGGFDCYVIEVKNANTKADYYFSNKGLILEKAISINKNDTIENEIKLIKIINGS